MEPNSCIGKTFGYLTVIEAPETKTGKFLCLCKCGNYSTPTYYGLKNGGSKSCGCISRYKTVARSTKHGAAKRNRHTSEYRVWRSMKARCNDLSCERYGARGIRVCDRWIHGDGTMTGFECFAHDLGPRPNGLTIERLDVNGHYSPENCVWATPKAQANNRRTNHIITVHGSPMTISQASEAYGIRAFLIRERIVEMGWDHTRAATTPPSQARADAAKAYRANPVRIIIVDGEEMTTDEASARWSIPKKEIHRRLNRGWDHNRAVKQPKYAMRSLNSPR